MNDLITKPNSKTDEKPVVIRNTTDLQRLKLQKLMKNPDKPVVIPERPKGRAMPTVPDFVRNVMGSSAGAGSGEFHVYRHLRRKEYARQKFIQERSEKDKLNDEYHDKLETNRKLQEEKTAKKRAKRLKRKIKAKQNAKKPKIDHKSESSDEGSSEQGDSDNSKEITGVESNDKKENYTNSKDDSIEKSDTESSKDTAVTESNDIEKKKSIKLDNSSSEEEDQNTEENKDIKKKS